MWQCVVSVEERLGGPALLRRVCTRRCEQHKGLHMGNSVCTVLSVLPQHRPNKLQNSRGKGSSLHVMALPMSGQDQGSMSQRFISGTSHRRAPNPLVLKQEIPMDWRFVSFFFLLLFFFLFVFPFYFCKGLKSLERTLPTVTVEWRGKKRESVSLK